MKVNRRTAMLLVVVVVVILAVYAITKWQQARETDDLLIALQSSDHGEAMKAMAALRERGSGIEAALIENMSNMGNPNVRWRSAMLLGAVNTRASRDALEAALRDSDDDVQMNAALSLGKLGDGRAAEALRDLAVSEDEEVPVRTAAVRALTMLRSGPHLPEVAALASKRPPVYPEGEEPEEAPPDDMLLLRKAAVAALGVLGVAADPGIGDRVLNSAGKGADTAAQAALNVLTESASDSLEPNVEVRATACTAIGDLAAGSGDEQLATTALRALIDVLGNDESGSVRIAAMDAINQIQVPDDMEQQVEQAREEALSDPHYWVREAAAAVGG